MVRLPLAPRMGATQTQTSASIVVDGPVGLTSAIELAKRRSVVATTALIATAPEPRRKFHIFAMLPPCF